MITYPVIAMCLTFVFAMTVNGVEYAKYDAGYQMAQYLNSNVKSDVIGYKIDLMSLDLHSQNNYQLVDDLNDIDTKQKYFYIVTSPNNIDEIRSKYEKVSTIKDFSGGSIETFLGNIVNPERLREKLNDYVILQVNR